ncbi:MAG: membrane protein insertase YidC [Pseudomonadaceae bacterium]|nr:membrane protein insertase YidC [Pseudomonadaceae bacterium]
MLDPQDKAQTTRLMLAVVISLVVLLGFELLGAGWRTAPPEQALEQAVAPADVAVEVSEPAAKVSQMEELVVLENDRMKLGLNPVGGRFDALVLKNFTVTQSDALGYAQLHVDGTHPEYVESGWLGAGIAAPGSGARWQVQGRQDDRVRLAFDNGSGQSFVRDIWLDAETYTVRVRDVVRNTAALPVTVTPYAQAHRLGGGLPGEMSSFVNHLGPMGVVRDDDEALLYEGDFDDIAKGKGSLTLGGKGGWWGIASQYFLTALVPPEGQEVTRVFKGGQLDGRPLATVGLKGEGLVVPAGGEAAYEFSVYAGPKQEDALLAVGHDLERAIDWGWFRMLARPFYRVLLWCHDLTGSWAVALFLLTLLLKIVTFPLANKSYHAMAKMKKLQPQMEALRERMKDNQQDLALEMMKLYQREKVNPLSGCWPMLIQIPVFFAMYKVVLLAFEFRHAAPELWPLDLWVHDMSVADPLFILPVLMGASMWVQMRLNPPPADPAQAMVFKWMPVMFTFMFLWFPAALVWYWLVNNVLSIAQQAYIMRKDKAI